MSRFHIHADLNDPAALPAAIAAATGETDVKVLAGWCGCDRETGELIEDEELASVSIEWMWRPGRFGLDVQVFCRDVAERETSARFARAVAKSLGRAVLFSDCSAFGYSYFSAEPDGSIWAQLMVIPERGEDEVMDLQTYDDPDPRYCCPRLVFRADESLPMRALGAPDSWIHGDTNCESAVAGRPCRAFNMACPQHRAPPA